MRNVRQLCTLTLVACGYVAASCRDPFDLNDFGSHTRWQQQTEASPRKVWTFLAYMNADNNLGAHATNDFAEMVQAHLGRDVEALALIDYDASKLDPRTGASYPAGVRLYRFQGDGREPQLLGEYAELDLDDPALLTRTVATVFSRFPSERRALVLWDHGGAWPGGFGGDDQNGTVSAPTPMAAETVARAIRDGLDLAQVTGPLDLLGFDACLMAGAEVAHEFTDVAHVYIADAELDYGSGWDYTAFLGQLADTPTVSDVELAKAEVHAWDAQHASADAPPSDRYLRSHAAFQTYELAGFMSALGDFVDTVADSAAVDGIALARAAYFAVPPYTSSLAGPTMSNPHMPAELRDLGAFLDRVVQWQSDASIVASARAARQALWSATIQLAEGELRTSAAQSGMHIELPMANILTPARMLEYTARAPRFVSTTGWDRLLAKYASFDDRTPPSLETSLVQAAPSADPLPALSLRADDPALAEASVRVALVDPDRPDRLIDCGILARGGITAGHAYTLHWNGRLLSLPDGRGGEQAADVEAWEPASSDFGTGALEASLLAILGVVQGDGPEYAAALVFRQGEETAHTLVRLDNSSVEELGSRRELAGATFTPVYNLYASGHELQELQRGQAFPLDASVAVRERPAPQGSYALIASASDVFGNESVSVQRAELSQPPAP